MNQNYSDVVEQVSQILLQAIQEREPSLCENVKQVDASLAKLLRLVGQQVMSMLFNNLAEQVTQEAKEKGLLIHRNSRIKYSVIFGNIEVNSPYLWDKKQHRGISPVKEKLGIKSGERSPYVKRALTDFGAEESFGQASQRFEEHYGWKVNVVVFRRK
ncbi:hypothetical protein AB0758_47875 [Tolypothrix bouteillei VB521301_2]|uniref:hypothetical protein n=1 Tax=Tolypothrix bouteillei TaxID=1246981 RepID=UPI0038B56211